MAVGDGVTVKGGCDQIMVLTPPASPIITVGVCLIGAALGVIVTAGQGFMSTGWPKRLPLKFPPISSGLTPFIRELCNHNWLWMTVACWLVMTPCVVLRVIDELDDDEQDVGCAKRGLVGGGYCCGGGDIINGLCLMTGLVLAGRPGELWGLGG